MEKVVDVLMNQDLLNEFLMLFELEKEVKKLGDFENYVFEVQKKSEQYILRLTHSSHRNREEILSEMDWMRHLHNHGVSVPEVFRSRNGLFVEEITAEDGTSFYGCMYAKVPGVPVSVRSEQFTPQLFKLWGEITAKMHAATKSYSPSKGIKRRSEWDEDEVLNIEKYFPAGEVELVANARRVIDAISALPKNQDNYGIIHTDIHSGNFFYDGTKIHVFDFDDACYHWFTSDIAIPLYYSIIYQIPASKERERQQFGELFLNAFIEGYQKENSLPEGWKQQVPLFLMLRDVVLYAVLHKKIAPEDRDEKLVEMMKEIEDRIRCLKPIVNVG
ncbi:phosphotransferase enzyme family protein [Mesobacillus subterraneus]|uniref:Aminoglycoside phosphotransferase domain-containing protein n=1 Tax=Mesobacillus subterraneus TaxID=285983 RepID=A0A3R9F3J5_9BACI|nr:phosphotransferase [Mesobacillus subterraneus]RSD28225.1 hypothetical protein EJA10_07165 [Mesobacillus subterraneus]